MEQLQKEITSLKIEPSNPYMQCLADILEPPTNIYLTNLIKYYESLLVTATKKKRDVIEKMLSDLKKKYKH